MERQRPERRVLLLGRSAAAPMVLAVTTVAGLVGAVLALLPAVVRRRPVGRVPTPRVEEAPASRTASEPIAP